MNAQHLGFLRNVFIKKISVILVVGMICAIIAGTEKYFTNDVQTKTGTAVAIQRIKFVDPDEHENIYHAFNYNQFMKSPGNVCKFVEMTANADVDEIDMKVLDADWYKMDIVKKYKWIEKNLFIVDLGDNQYELTVVADASMPKDAVNFGNGVEKFLMFFMKTTLSELRETKPNVSLDIIYTKIIEPEVLLLPQRDIVIKYAIVGFFLGCILSTVGVFTVALRKQ